MDARRIYLSTLFQIFVLMKGTIAVEKEVYLEEVKERESEDVRKVRFVHKISEFSSAEIIGDEILEEKG